jgi:hypothetical protein
MNFPLPDVNLGKADSRGDIGDLGFGGNKTTISGPNVNDPTTLVIVGMVAIVAVYMVFGRKK